MITTITLAITIPALISGVIAAAVHFMYPIYEDEGTGPPQADPWG